MNGKVAVWCGFAAVMAAMTAMHPLMAREVTGREAMKAVQRWLADSPAFGCKSGEEAASVRTCTPSDDVRFHVVKLSGGGFVVTSADTAHEPVVAFSSGGDFEESDRNPLWVLMKRDFAIRAASVRKSAGGMKLAGASPVTAEASANERKWARLLGGGFRLKSGDALEQDSISDLRVAPFVQSKWYQTTVAPMIGSKDCYNLDTPNNYPCGCVATAGAQTMRYFEWPAASAVMPQFTNVHCKVDGAYTNMVTRGGSYDWSLMPLVPDEDTPELERQTIGKLTSDIGICCGMAYTEEASTVGMYMLAEALTNHFGYSGAVIAQWNEGEDHSTSNEVKNAIVSNLDAGRPVLFSIADGTGGGHTIVGDGYGYSGESLYIHMNFGWAGMFDAWYAPPALDTGGGPGYNFNAVDGLMFNIFTDQQADSVICSGRVFDSAGNPVAGATITCTSEDPAVAAACAAATTTTGEKGIYALVLPPGSYTVSAKFGSCEESIPILLEPNEGSQIVTSGEQYGGFWTEPKPRITNLSGKDITLLDLVGVEAPQFDPPSCSFHPCTNVSITCGTPGATIRYTLDGTEPTFSSAAYTGPILVDYDTTIKAKAWRGAMNPSEIVTATYTYDASQGEPKGDSFDNAFRIFRMNGTNTVADISAYTVEPGEPNHTTEPGYVDYDQYHTIWHRWIAPGTGMMTFTVTAKAAPGEPYAAWPMMAVYTGNGLSSLSRILYDANEDQEWLVAEVSFHVTKGEEYRIVCTSAGGDTGSFEFAWSGNLDYMPAGLSEKDVLCTYDGAGHTIDANVLETDFRSALVGDSGFEYARADNCGDPVLPWSAEPPEFTNACNEVVLCRVRNLNYGDFTYPANVTIMPVDIGGWTDGTKWSATLSGDGVKYDGVPKTCTVGSVSYDGFELPSFSVSGNTATDAGDYELTVTGTGNYCGSKTFPWSIAKREVTLASSSANKVYDGTPLTAPVALSYGDDFASGEGAFYLSFASQTQAGSCQNTFTYSFLPNTKAGNYTISQIYGILTVTKADNAWITEPSVENWIYGQPASALNMGVAKFGTATVSYSATPGDAGDYTATFTVEETDNYSGLSLPVDFTISKATYDMSMTAWDYLAPFTYDGNPHAVALSGLPSGVSATYSGDYTATDAGNYVAHANFTYDAANYNAPSIADCNWMIAKKSISGATITLSDGILKYNGLPQTQIVTGVTAGGLDATYDVSGNTATEPGDYTLTVTGTGNFTGTETKSWKIWSDGIAQQVTPYDGIYDGEGHGISVTVVEPDTYTVKYAYAVEGPYTADEIILTNVTEEAVTVWYTVEADGYTTVTNSGTVNISPKTLTDEMVTVAGTAYVYDGTAKEPAVTVADGEPSIITEADYDVAYSNNVDTGEATVTVTGKGNYTGEVIKHFTIAGAEVALPSIASKAYTGGVLKSGLSNTAFYTVAENGGVNVGNYPVTLTLTDPANYRWAGGGSSPANLIFTITKAANAWIKAPSISGWTSGETPSAPYKGVAKFGQATVAYGASGAKQPVDPGSYTATFTVAGTSNYAGLSKAVPFTILEPPRRDLWDDDTEFHLDAAATWDGYLLDQDDVVAGIISIKAGKPDKNQFVKLTITIELAGEKKVALKAETKDGHVTGSIGGQALDMQLGYASLSGKYGAYTLGGSRNLFTGKDAYAVQRSAQANSRWQGVYAAAWDGGSGWNGISVEVKAKGKAKVTGTLSDGTKVSAKAQLLVGEHDCAIAISWMKKTARVTCLIWLREDGTLECGNLPGGAEAVVGDSRKGSSLVANSKFRIDKNAVAAAIPDACKDLLPDGLSVRMAGASFDVDKPGKVKLRKDKSGIDPDGLGTNPSGMKISYTAKTCSFKGAFQVYTLSQGKLKKVKVDVNGVVIGGRGYGTATVKKPAKSWPVTIAP